jgi:Na+-translocating ferredoxin:NAD+ oxidoreductase RnfD subunit
MTTATPLAFIKTGFDPAKIPSTWDMLIGNMPGCIGEVSAIAIVLGGVYLLVRKVISWHIPVSFLATVVIYAVISGRAPAHVEVLTGGVMIGAVFMATDYVTAPITKKGQIVYGAVLGILTGLFRLFGGSAEGVSYAIIIGNLLVPLIEKVTLPKPFGKGGEK